MLYKNEIFGVVMKFFWSRWLGVCMGYW